MARWMGRQMARSWVLRLHLAPGRVPERVPERVLERVPEMERKRGTDSERWMER
jgi:hypothetical protein